MDGRKNVLAAFTVAGLLLSNDCKFVIHVQQHREDDGIVSDAIVPAAARGQYRGPRRDNLTVKVTCSIQSLRRSFQGELG